jgi:hypothetical protein
MMNKMKSCFLILIGIFGISFQVNAQEFMLNGAVFENGTKIRIALSEVTNKRNGYSVGTNDMGIFSVKAIVGDTILIAKRGFSDREIVVVSTQSIIVNLNRANTLDEVVINGMAKKQTMEAIKNDFRSKGSFYAGKPPLLSYIFTPLTALYETFGRTPRNARRFERYYQTEMRETRVDQFFNRTLITKETGLEGKELDNFMINYRPDYEQAKNWNIYDATKWIKDSFKKYNAALKKS